MILQKVFKIIISYNKIGKYSEPTISTHSRGNVLILPFTFCPSKNAKNKGPHLVHEDDPNIKILVAFIMLGLPDSVDIFIGKKESGSLEMIDFFYQTPELAPLREKFFWVLCDHNLEEKLERLESYGVPRTSEKVYRFSDNRLPCRESIILLGRIADDLE